MLKHILYLILFTSFLASCSTMRSPKNIPNKRIEFDFMKPEYPPVTTIRPKQSVEVVLKNVNASVYEVSINDTLITYPNQQPSQFGDIFKITNLAPVPKTTPPSNDSGTGKKPSKGLQTAKTNETARDAELTALLSEYGGLELNTKDFLEYASTVDELKKLIVDCSLDITALKQKADEYISAAIPGLQPLQATFPLGIESKINSELASVIKKVNDFLVRAEALKKDYQNVLNSANGGMSLDDYKKLEKSVKEKISLIDTALNNATELKRKLAEFQTAKVGAAIVNSYNKVLGSRTEIAKIVPSGFGVDEISIKVNVTKKGELTCAKTVSSFPITVVVARGVKIDFSTGLALNVGRKKFFEQEYFYDSVYRVDKTIADSVQIRTKRNDNVIVPSLGVFMHVYTRGLSHVNIGGMVGASIGADQRLCYHVGGNLLFGKSDRLILGFGASIAKSTLLDGQYIEGQIINRAHAPTSIPTQTPTRVGGFVSFSWNLNLIK